MSKENLLPDVDRQNQPQPEQKNLPPVSALNGLAELFRPDGSTPEGWPSMIIDLETYLQTASEQAGQVEVLDSSLDIPLSQMAHSLIKKIDPELVNPNLDLNIPTHRNILITSWLLHLKRTLRDPTKPIHPNPSLVQFLELASQEYVAQRADDAYRKGLI